MSLETKLSQWQAAGLIDSTTRARIDAFEAERRRPVLLYALGGLGALTLGIGIISVVAANWAEIGKLQKLAADLVLGAGLAAGLYVSAVRGRSWLSDVLAGVYYAFTLASIALLGQIYQLGAPTWQALVTWSLCTAPFMLLVRGRLLGTVWLAGLLATHVSVFAEVMEWLDRGHDFDDVWQMNFATTLAFASALGFVALARVPWFVRERPEPSSAWSNALWMLIALGSCSLGFVWYTDVHAQQHLTWALATSAAILAAFHALLPRFYPSLTARARTAIGAFLAASWLVLATGASFSHPELEAIGAIEQVVLLGLCAYAAIVTHHERAFNALTAAIALRVLVMYFEVFGSMLDTGLGMITGGLLTLLLAWIWKRKSPEIAARWGADVVTHGGPHAA